MKRAVLGGVLVLLLLVALWPAAVARASSITLQACRDVTFRDLGAFGTEVLPVACGREFSASDPYVFLHAKIDRVDTLIEVTMELLDPTGAAVTTRRFALQPGGGQMVTYTGGWVLLLAADAAQLPPGLRRYNLIVPPGTPARERHGEWTWKIGSTGFRVGRGPALRSGSRSPS